MYLNSFIFYNGLNYYQNKLWLITLGLCLSESDQTQTLGLASNMNNDDCENIFPFRTGIPVL